MKPSRDRLGTEENRIHDLLLEMAGSVETSLADALLALRRHDVRLAERLVRGDDAINRRQQGIEERCFATIARQQPVASDLRDLVANTYIAAELERIADHASAVAKIVLEMEKALSPEIVDPIATLGETCLSMLRRIMVAYNEVNVEDATRIAGEDRDVDDAEKQIQARLFRLMSENPAHSIEYTKALWVAHLLERTADRITNIAERIVFMASGETTNLNR